MKKYLFIIAAAATCLLVACSKEKELRAPETNTEETTASEFVRLPGWTYIGASNIEESKASLTDDATPVFKWNAGDKIALFTDNNDYLVSGGLDNSFDGATEAEFAFEGENIDEHRAFFAVYPASLVSGCDNPTANSLAINLPASYTLAQVQGEVSPIPMVAANAPGGALAFKSVCALLRITVKNIAKDAQSIKVRFPGQKVNGAFALADFVAGTSGVAGAASSSEAEETITITDLGISAFVEQMVINVPVPMGTFDYVVTGAYDESGLIINYINTPVKVVSNVPTPWTPGRKSRRTLTAGLPVFTFDAGGFTDINSAEWKNNTNRPECKRVVFAPGNLQAKLLTVPLVATDGSGNPTNNGAMKSFGNASEWRFAPHQYTAIGDSIPPGRTASLNSLAEAEVGDWIDLFCWMGNDATNSNLLKKDSTFWYGLSYGCTSGTSSYVGNTTGATLAYDWGTCWIKYRNEGPYKSGTYRTPTATEWEFVLINRTANGNRISQGAKATLIRSVGDTVARGMIILPDHFECPYGVTPIQKAYSQSNKSYDSASGGSVCSDNVYTLADWEKLEGAGCVFLPLTNMRSYNATPSLNTNNPGVGLYWSSTNKSTSTCYALAFNCLEAGRVGAYNGNNNTDPARDNVQFKYSRNRPYCLGVRLVREVN